MFWKKTPKSFTLKDWLKLLQILEIIKSKAHPEMDTTWARERTYEEHLAEMNEFIELIQNKDDKVIDQLKIHFAPTASFQELSMANGWSEEYIGLAHKFDKIAEAYDHSRIILLKEGLKKISITGRVAYGIICLEKMLNHFKIRDNKMSRSLNKLWEFTDCSDLSKWDDQMKELSPLCLSDPKETFEDYQFITNEEAKELRDYYKTLPEKVTDTIDSVYEIGGSNLYGGTSSYSKSSHDEVSNVIDTMTELKLELPYLSDFPLSPFSEKGSWGENRPKEHFRNPYTQYLSE